MRFPENDYHDPARLDFVPRSYKRQFFQIIVAFTLCFSALLIVGVLDAMRASAYSSVLSLISILVMSLYILVLKQRDIDTLMNTEYQNMLFSQGVQLGVSFYLYVRSDGTIVYMNDGMRKLLHAEAVTETQNIEGLLAFAGVTATDRQRINQSITLCQNDRLVFPLMVDKQPRDFVITIDPLPRPAGIMLLRGREFHDTRSGTQLLPDLLRATTPEKLDHMLSASPAAHYVTDAYGKLEYVNRAFEELLHYAAGDALAHGVTLDKLFVSLPNTDELDPHRLIDYSGDVQMVRRDGGHANAMLFQSLIRDEHGKITAATGTILPFKAMKDASA